MCLGEIESNSETAKFQYVVDDINYKTESIVAVHLRLKFEQTHCYATETKKKQLNCNENSVLMLSNCHNNYDPSSRQTINIRTMVTDIDITKLLTMKQSICLRLKTIDSGRQIKNKNILQYLVYSHAPVLLVYSQDNDSFSSPVFVPFTTNHNNIKKRGASPGGLLKSSKSKPCHKVRHYINFKRIGYNTKKIIIPSGYYANYCHGHCLFPLPHTKMTLHAQIQSLAAQLRGDVPLPCCSPVRHRSLVMLAYSESDNLVLKRKKNMSVSKCGCV